MRFNPLAPIIVLVSFIVLVLLALIADPSLISQLNGQS
ncbi:MAG: hypothetical protein CEO22_556 [Candidatus Berkelbacteria bacterium Gr01-1014_85]|uniref:Uncharacterized protein n=1 Tax=Candidatus Berkelbacteria bacterium Gr01-1014_85 TaxID=2017150 RepID=A0A554JA54_9BACT|nr:MAG: hypothetical protein CEO22_556 [Candidatus Berkelbacteria bacterium Gr01-1014_85]